MSEAAMTLMQAVMELTEAERLKIADTVYESLQDHSTLSEDDPGLNAILQQRLNAHLSGSDPGIPGDEVFRKLRELR